jgi:hypothetical protein
MLLIKVHMRFVFVVTEVDDRSVYRCEPDHDVTFQCIEWGSLVVFLCGGTNSLLDRR